VAKEMKMRKRIVVVVVLAILWAASAYAQAVDFFTLVRSGTPQEVQSSISKGANVRARNQYGWTPFMVAVYCNQNPEVIATLLKSGSDIDARDSDYGATALMWASEANQNLEIFTTLLKAGADLRAQDTSGATALIWAAGHIKNPDVIIALLKAGADARAKDSAGRTAFDYAQGNADLQGTDALKQLEEASK
jgi:ankyrin repeat protein